MQRRIDHDLPRSGRSAARPACLRRRCKGHAVGVAKEWLQVNDEPEKLALHLAMSLPDMRVLSNYHGPPAADKLPEVLAAPIDDGPADEPPASGPSRSCRPGG